MLAVLSVLSYHFKYQQNQDGLLLSVSQINAAGFLCPEMKKTDFNLTLIQTS